MFVNLLLDEPCTFLDFTLHTHVGLPFAVSPRSSVSGRGMRQEPIFSSGNLMRSGSLIDARRVEQFRPSRCGQSSERESQDRVGGAEVGLPNGLSAHCQKWAKASIT